MSFEHGRTLHIPVELNRSRAIDVDAILRLVIMISVHSRIIIFWISENMSEMCGKVRSGTY